VVGTHGISGTLRGVSNAILHPSACVEKRAQVYGGPDLRFTCYRCEITTSGLRLQQKGGLNMRRHFFFYGGKNETTKLGMPGHEDVRGVSNLFFSPSSSLPNVGELGDWGQHG
jgi:hypothetical protein